MSAHEAYTRGLSAGFHGDLDYAIGLMRQMLVEHKRLRSALIEVKDLAGGPLPDTAEAADFRLGRIAGVASAALRNADDASVDKSADVAGSTEPSGPARRPPSSDGSGRAA